MKNLPPNPQNHQTIPPMTPSLHPVPPKSPNNSSACLYALTHVPHLPAISSPSFRMSTRKPCSVTPLKPSRPSVSWPPILPENWRALVAMSLWVFSNCPRWANCWSIERWTTWSRPGDRLKVVQLPALNNRAPLPNGGFSSWIDTCLSLASTATSHHC